MQIHQCITMVMLWSCYVSLATTLWKKRCSLPVKLMGPGLTAYLTAFPNTVNLSI